MHADEVVVVDCGDCVGAVFAIDFHLVEHLASSLRLYYQSQLSELIHTSHFQMIQLTPLLREHELHHISGIQMLQIRPFQLDLIFTSCLAIYYNK